MSVRKRQAVTTNQAILIVAIIVIAAGGGYWWYTSYQERQSEESPTRPFPETSFETYTGFGFSFDHPEARARPASLQPSIARCLTSLRSMPLAAMYGPSETPSKWR